MSPSFTLTSLKLKNLKCVDGLSVLVEPSLAVNSFLWSNFIQMKQLIVPFLDYCNTCEKPSFFCLTLIAFYPSFQMSLFVNAIFFHFNVEIPQFFSSSVFLINFAPNPIRCHQRGQNVEGCDVVVSV